MKPLSSSSTEDVTDKNKFHPTGAARSNSAPSVPVLRLPAHAYVHAGPDAHAYDGQPECEQPAEHDDRRSPDNCSVEQAAGREARKFLQGYIAAISVEESTRRAQEYLDTLKETNNVYAAADGGWTGLHMVDTVKNASLSMQSTLDEAIEAEAVGPAYEEELSSDDSDPFNPMGHRLQGRCSSIHQ